MLSTSWSRCSHLARKSSSIFHHDYSFNPHCHPRIYHYSRLSTPAFPSALAAPAFLPSHSNFNTLSQRFFGDGVPRVETSSCFSTSIERDSQPNVQAASHKKHSYQKSVELQGVSQHETRMKAVHAARTKIVETLGQEKDIVELCHLLILLERILRGVQNVDEEQPILWKKLISYVNDTAAGGRDRALSLGLIALTDMAGGQGSASGRDNFSTLLGSNSVQGANAVMDSFAAELQSGKGKTSVSQGRGQEVMGKDRYMEKELTRALRQGIEHVILHLLRMGQWELCHKATSVVSVSRNTLFHMMLYSAVKKKNLVEARKLFDALNSSDPAIWNMLLQLYVSTGRWEEAKALGQKMSEKSKNAETHLTLLRCYGRLEDVEGVEREWEELRRLIDAERDTRVAKSTDLMATSFLLKAMVDCREKGIPNFYEKLLERLHDLKIRFSLTEMKRFRGKSRDRSHLLSAYAIVIREAGRQKDLETAWALAKEVDDIQGIDLDQAIFNALLAGILESASFGNEDMLTFARYVARQAMETAIATRQELEKLGKAKKEKKINDIARGVRLILRLSNAFGRDHILSSIAEQCSKVDQQVNRHLVNTRVQSMFLVSNVEIRL